MLEGARLVLRVMLYSTDSSLAGSPTLRIHTPSQQADSHCSKACLDLQAGEVATRQP